MSENDLTLGEAFRLAALGHTVVSKGSDAFPLDAEKNGVAVIKANEARGALGLAQLLEANAHKATQYPAAEPQFGHGAAGSPGAPAAQDGAPYAPTPTRTLLPSQVETFNRKVIALRQAFQPPNPPPPPPRGLPA